MKYVYRAVFKPLDQGRYFIEVPALPGCLSEGKDLYDAIYMIRDACAMWLALTEEENGTIPPDESADIVLDPGDFISYIDVDTQVYREYYDQHPVKKTLTIPSWLNRQAEAADISFSKLLQSALKDKLGVSQVPQMKKHPPLSR